MELACFSKSRADGDTYDKSQLKRYFRPSVPFDLSEGFDTFRDRDRNNPRPANLEPIFESLREAGVDERVLASADVISWRGNLSKLLATPWNTRDAWHMEAELVHGVVVLNVLEPAENLAREANRQGRDALMCYWGFSFEEACTGGTYDQPIDCLNAYCAVVRAGVGRHRLVLGGEVDCWDGQTEGLGGYVELKTTRIMETASQVARFERDKLLKWWAQSFAVGVRRILVGFRDDDGAVRKLQSLETLKLPGYAARHPGAWDPKTALQFADKFLTWLRAHLSSIPEGSRVRVEYEPRRHRHEVRATVDPDAPDFVPARARERLARAAAIRAAGGATSSGGGRSGSHSRGSGGGGSVGGGGGGGGTAAAAKRRAMGGGGGGAAGGFSGGSGVSASAPASDGGGKHARGAGSVVFKEPEPRATRPRGSGSTAGATPPAKKPIGDASGSDSIAIAMAAPAPTSASDQNQNRTSDDPSSDPASANASLVERFVHWYGNEGARAPDRRRRRRHERSQTPVPGSRPHDRAGARELREFHHPIVGGPGFGDPLKMAADKLAYARALGPAALSYLAGFTPGDAGWRGDECGNGGDGGGGVAANASKPADGPGAGGGVEPVGDGAAPRGFVASAGAASAGAPAGTAAGSRYPPRNPDPVPATAAMDFGYGLDPRAFAFDPLDPAPPPQPVAKVSGGSEVDGQQSSYVTTGDANANADADADAAGEAGSVGGASALGDTPEGSAGEAGAAVTATATSANDAGDDAGANKRKRESE